MSNVAHLNQGQEVAAPDMQAPYATHTANMLMNSQIMHQLQSFAEMMAGGVATVPQHLRKNKADCMAVVMQAAQWGMNPFAVAQKTHLTQGGQLGYEAQLVNAVITSNGPFIGRPEYEFLGEWDKILGKVQERKSDKGGKYYVAAWNQNDEEGLGVIVRATLKGEDEPRELKLMLRQCFPRFSTQWATDPQQQITFAGLKKFARRYCPDVILGVYTPDEFEQIDTQVAEREINPAPSAPQTSSQASSLKNRVQKTQAPAQSQHETVEPEPQAQKPSMPDFGEPEADPLPPVDELLKHLPNCANGSDMAEWKQDAMKWPEGSPEYQQLVGAYNTHLAKLKAQSAEGEQ